MNQNLLEKSAKLAGQIVEEQRFTLSGVSWQQYETLRGTLDNFPAVRMTYLEGMLEIFMPSSEHEMIKKLLARLLELYSVEASIRLYGCGSTTYRKKAKERGLEPDESYCVGKVKELPDIALEVIVTSGTINKLEVYRGLRIPEVWLWQDRQLSLHSLQGKTYEAIAQSKFLPDLDLALFVRCANLPDQYDAVIEFRNALRV